VNFCPKCGVNELKELSSVKEGDRDHSKYKCNGCGGFWGETVIFEPFEEDSVLISSIRKEDIDEEEEEDPTDDEEG